MIGLCKINVSDKLGIDMMWYVQSVYTYIKIHEFKEGKEGRLVKTSRLRLK